MNANKNPPDLESSTNVGDKNKVIINDIINDTSEIDRKQKADEAEVRELELQLARKLAENRALNVAMNDSLASNGHGQPSGHPSDDSQKPTNMEGIEQSIDRQFMRVTGKKRGAMAAFDDGKNAEPAATQPKKAIKAAKKQRTRTTIVRAVDTLPRFARPSASASSDPPVTTSNKFAALQNSSSSTTDTQTEVDGEVNASNSRKRAPKIIITSNRTKALNELSIAGFKFQGLNARFDTKLQPDSTIEWEKMMDFCRANGIKAYTHPSGPSAKLYTIAKGIVSLDAKLIHSALSQAGFPPLDIRRIPSSDDSPLWAIDFAKEVASIYKLKEQCAFIGPMEIIWRKSERKQRGPTICYKCAMIGHGAAFCTRDDQCVCCAGQHQIAQCKAREVPTSYKCVNCLRQKKTNYKHAATDPNCECRLEYLQRKQLNETRSLAKKQQKASVNKQARVSFDLHHHAWPGAGRAGRIGVNSPALAHSTAASYEVGASETNTSTASQRRARSLSLTQNSSPSTSTGAHSPFDLRRAASYAENLKFNLDETAHSQQASQTSNRDANNELFSLQELFSMMVDTAQQLQSAGSKIEQLSIMAQLFQKCLTK